MTKILLICLCCLGVAPSDTQNLFSNNSNLLSQEDSLHNSIVISSPIAPWFNSMEGLDISDYEIPDRMSLFCFNNILSMSDQLLPDNINRLSIPLVKKLKNNAYKEIYPFMLFIGDKEFGEISFIAQCVTGLIASIENKEHPCSNPALCMLLAGDKFKFLDRLKPFLDVFKVDDILDEVEYRLNNSMESMSIKRLIDNLAPDHEKYFSKLIAFQKVLNAWENLKILLAKETTNDLLGYINITHNYLSDVLLKEDNDISEYFPGFTILQSYLKKMIFHHSLSNEHISRDELCNICSVCKYQLPQGDIFDWLDIHQEALSYKIWESWKPDSKHLQEYLNQLKNYAENHYQQEYILPIAGWDQIAGHTFSQADKVFLNDKYNPKKLFSILNTVNKNYSGSLYEYTPQENKLFARGAFFNTNISDKDWFSVILISQFDKIINGLKSSLQSEIITSYFTVISYITKRFQYVDFSIYDINLKELKAMRIAPKYILDLYRKASTSIIDNIFLCLAVLESKDYKDWIKIKMPIKFLRDINSNNSVHRSLESKQWFQNLMELSDSKNSSFKKIAIYILLEVYKDIINIGLEECIARKKVASSKQDLIDFLFNRLQNSNLHPTQRRFFDIRVNEFDVILILKNLNELFDKVKNLAKEIYSDIKLSDFMNDKYGNRSPKSLIYSSLNENIIQNRSQSESPKTGLIGMYLDEDTLNHSITVSVADITASRRRQCIAKEQFLLRDSNLQVPASPGLPTERSNSLNAGTNAESSSPKRMTFFNDDSFNSSINNRQKLDSSMNLSNRRRTMSGGIGMRARGSSLSRNNAESQFNLDTHGNFSLPGTLQSPPSRSVVRSEVISPGLNKKRVSNSPYSVNDKESNREDKISGYMRLSNGRLIPIYDYENNHYSAYSNSQNNSFTGNNITKKEVYSIMKNKEGKERADLIDYNGSVESSNNFSDRLPEDTSNFDSLSCSPQSTLIAAKLHDYKAFNQAVSSVTEVEHMLSRPKRLSIDENNPADE